ncbi:MFS transporter [Buttiauxella warmboldiae]|uniref:MFS transporter n=1 Tax=Buttiauxella warmboldiae TaxID=82993 RepID=A0A3N5DE45_9ENTR|nr:MFS transporter [Buttiauxella warmboldiae]RPH25531.1 MFS transporter [Buttiauxella warmboldiae]
MKPQRIPLQVWILTLSAFAIGTAEFVVAGLLTTLAHSLNISDGQAGNVITAYAMAIVIGGPVLTLWLARFEKRNVLAGLMVMFIAANLVSALATSYSVLLVSRVLAGLVQGPFYGIGAVVATRLVAESLAGRAVGQMFAGLTLANVLGVPFGSWIGNIFGWNVTFYVVAALGAVALVAIMLTIERQPIEQARSIRQQLKAFRHGPLLASLAITVLCWTGFMTLYGYIAPLAEQVAGYSVQALTVLLFVVGIGLVVGNHIGGITADRNLRHAQLLWPLLMVASLVIVGLVSSHYWLFMAATFLFGIASFGNVPPLQMSVLKHGSAAPELAGTANISAFNLANALGGIIGGLTVDSTLGAVGIPWVATLIPVAGIAFVLFNRRNSSLKVQAVR